jgi:hypothetical protein
MLDESVSGAEETVVVSVILNEVPNCGFQKKGRCGETIAGLNLGEFKIDFRSFGNSGG